MLPSSRLQIAGSFVCCHKSWILSCSITISGPCLTSGWHVFVCVNLLVQMNSCCAMTVVLPSLFSVFCTTRWILREKSVFIVSMNGLQTAMHPLGASWGVLHFDMRLALFSGWPCRWRYAMVRCRSRMAVQATCWDQVCGRSREEAMLGKHSMMKHVCCAN